MTTPTTTTLTVAAERAREGRLAAEARMAAMPLQHRLLVALTVAAAIERLPRTFVGPGTEKGRQPMVVLTPVEYKAFLATGLPYFERAV